MEKEIFTLDDIYEAMMQSRDLAVEQGFSYNSVLKIQLATEEACTNAYEYSRNRNQASCAVKWKASPDYLEVIVRQEGAAFSLRQPENVVMGQRGRGITLILNLMDFVEMRENKGFIELIMRKIKGV